MKIGKKKITLINRRAVFYFEDTRNNYRKMPSIRSIMKSVKIMIQI